MDTDVIRTDPAAGPAAGSAAAPAVVLTAARGTARAAAPGTARAGVHAPAADAGPHLAPEAAVEHLVIMGVAGSGKSTIATLLATRSRAEYAEADAFHSPESIARMAAGTPLTDADRAPWLASIRDWLSAEADAGRPGVVTCSALKRGYRDVLRSARGRVRFVHLTGSPALLAERMAHRSGHFMPTSLLPSQLATLEPLGADEDGITVDVSASPAAIVDSVLARLAVS